MFLHYYYYFLCHADSWSTPSFYGLWGMVAWNSVFLMLWWKERTGRALCVPFHTRLIGGCKVPFVTFHICRYLVEESDWQHPGNYDDYVSILTFSYVFLNISDIYSCYYLGKCIFLYLMIFFLSSCLEKSTNLIKGKWEKMSYLLVLFHTYELKNPKIFFETFSVFRIRYTFCTQEN